MAGIYSDCSTREINKAAISFYQHRPVHIYIRLLVRKLTKCNFAIQLKLNDRTEKKVNNHILVETVTDYIDV